MQRAPAAAHAAGRNKLREHSNRTYIALFMSLRMRWIVVAALATVLTPACEFVSVEPQGELPVLSAPQATFDDRDNSFYAAVTVTLPQEDSEPPSIWVELYLATGALADSLGTDSVLAASSLLDSATGGDILPSDGVYASKFDSPLPVGAGGFVRIEFLAIVSGDTSQESVILGLINIRPVILSVSAADTLRLPPEGFVTVDTIRAVVDDPDGLSDIRSVSFLTLKPDSTLGNDGLPVELADNGDLVGWGDATAVDGLFSRIILLQAEAALGTYIYSFVAKDFRGAVSDTVKHTVVVQ
ncbi:MAG: hypothetical protein IH971_06750 [Candidatus Marinimicrobia bacterium]|nr:hypothetical protein [Candidatus Neomarinimicrobiota bacterium]